MDRQDEARARRDSGRNKAPVGTTGPHTHPSPAQEGTGNAPARRGRAYPARGEATRKEHQTTMSGVRLLVGTRKGAFILTSDGKREKWDVCGPYFAGWEIYHMKGSPADPNRIYVSQTSGWFGQQVQLSKDGGKTFEAVNNKFLYDGPTGTHQWYDGTPHPWEFKRVWHFEPSLADPDTVYAGVEDAALFRSADGGQTWEELS